MSTLIALTAADIVPDASDTTKDAVQTQRASTTTPIQLGVRIAAAMLSTALVLVVWRLLVDGNEFDPDELRRIGEDPVEGLTIFAVFFVAAAGVERFLEPFAGVISAITAKNEGDATEKAVTAVATDAGDAPTKVKALATAKAVSSTTSDVVKVVFWAIATCVGIFAADKLDLLLLRQVGIAAAPPNWDILATGLIIGAGTKPMHDLIGLIEKKKETAANTAAATTGTSP